MSAVPYHSWVSEDSQDNAAATATKAAPGSGIAHYITSISAGFSGSVSGATLHLKEGSTVLGRWRVYDSLTLSFSSPIKLTPGTVANLELAASGTPGTVGDVTMSGFTL